MQTDSVLELDDEEQPCIKCNGFTDTGFECVDCGFDNRDWYMANTKASSADMANTDD